MVKLDNRLKANVPVLSRYFSVFSPLLTGTIPDGHEHPVAMRLRRDVAPAYTRLSRIFVVCAVIVMLAGTAGCSGSEISHSFISEDGWVLVKAMEQSPIIFGSYSFSPDEKTFVATASDGGIRIYESSSGEVKHDWPSGQNRVFRACFSPDGSRIVTAGDGPALVVWDTKTRTCVAKYGDLEAERKVGNRVDDIDWSADGCSLATLDARTDYVSVWQADSLKKLAVLKGHTDFVAGCRFSPVRDELATISFDKTVRIWDSTGFSVREILTEHQDRILCMAYSPDGRYLVTGGLRTLGKGAKNVIVWNTETWESMRKLPHPRDVGGVQFSDAGKFLRTSDRYNIYLWDVETWERLGKTNRAEFKLDMAVFSREGRYAITMTNWGSADRMLFIWRYSEGD